MKKNSRHQPRKRFGQNFLHDPYIINRIIDLFDPGQSDLVVEIGPGLGALTWPLLEKLEQLHAIELDRDLVARFREDPRTPGHLHLHKQDALSFDFSTLASSSSKLRIIGNLPYNISTPLLFHLLTFSTRIHDMMFMLQKEVVQRIIAAPGGKEYGRLSVTLQARCSVKKVLDVSPGAFSPPPRVDSAVVHLVPYQQSVIDFADTEAFANIVKISFSQRRKTLRNNLRGVLTENEIEMAGISPAARAETLSVSDFSLLTGIYLQKEPVH
jgi:16S rRNA (adenine1518-N6/adenine1519-N6)-dimethyltransferase